MLVENYHQTDGKQSSLLCGAARPSSGRFDEKLVVDMTELVYPLVSVHSVAGFADADGFLDGGGELLGRFGFGFVKMNFHFL